VPGAVIIVVVLLLFPVLVAIGGLILAAIIGSTLYVDGRKRSEGSELLDVNV
jgi:hypothetical protein